jgi:hypothetical protein
VPAGATVYEIAPGIISDVLGALGEQRSHSMLSHGPNTWVTHATSTTPPYVANCDNPVDKGFMGASTPGLSTIDQGAAYTFLYLNGGAPTDLYYQNARLNGSTAIGQTIANMFLGSDEFGDQWTWNQMGSGTNTIWGMNFAYNNGTPSAPQLVNNGQIYYGWYQYMNTQSTPQGYPPSQQGGQGYGVTCSSSLSMWQHDALWNQTGYTGDVLPRTYSTTAITAAANALFGDIYNKCKGATNIASGGSFDVSVWSGIACLGISVCSNAANQIVHGFASPGGYVDDVGADWQNIVHTTPAVSISPDDVAGWNLNGTGAPVTGNGSSVWGWDGNNYVQWNNAGNSYGCW